jgi:hypothetical protein
MGGRAEVGDEAVIAAVEAARAQIADGSLWGFSDKKEVLEYHRSPAPALLSWRVFPTDSSQPDHDALTRRSGGGYRGAVRRRWDAPLSPPSNGCSVRGTAGRGYVLGGGERRRT